MLLNLKKLIFRIFNLIFLYIIIIGVISCENVFEYSPYSGHVQGKDKDTRLSNLEKLSIQEKATSENKTFTFALISDSHTFYNDLDDAVLAINENENIEFVIHGGDLTDGGMIKEYEIFHNIVSDLNYPYFTVIGNHDCLANGLGIYKNMYGIDNYSFTYKDCKFIFFNNIIWELGYIEPDFFWLQSELEDTTSYEQVFVIAHIPPWSDQFTPVYSKLFEHFILTYNVSLSIHGHHHDHYFGCFFDDEKEYLVIGSVDKRYYCTITVFQDSISLDRIHY